MFASETSLGSGLPEFARQSRIFHEVALWIRLKFAKPIKFDQARRVDVYWLGPGEPRNHESQDPPIFCILSIPPRSKVPASQGHVGKRVIAMRVSRHYSTACKLIIHAVRGVRLGPPYMERKPAAAEPTCFAHPHSSQVFQTLHLISGLRPGDSVDPGDGKCP
jgi:hypothetical protein